MARVIQCRKLVCRFGGHSKSFWSVPTVVCSSQTTSDLLFFDAFMLETVQAAPPQT